MGTSWRKCTGKRGTREVVRVIPRAPQALPHQTAAAAARPLDPFGGAPPPLASLPFVFPFSAPFAAGCASCHAGHCQSQADDHQSVLQDAGVGLADDRHGGGTPFDALPLTPVLTPALSDAVSTPTLPFLAPLRCGARTPGGKAGDPDRTPCCSATVASWRRVASGRRSRWVLDPTEAPHRRTLSRRDWKRLGTSPGMMSRSFVSKISQRPWSASLSLSESVPGRALCFMSGKQRSNCKWRLAVPSGVS